MTRPHHPECLCPHCERTGGGIFAQRAVLAGDPAAARRLSRPVFEVLASERARRRARLQGTAADPLRTAS